MNAKVIWFIIGVSIATITEGSFTFEEKAEDETQPRELSKRRELLEDMIKIALLQTQDEIASEVDFSNTIAEINKMLLSLKDRPIEYSGVDLPINPFPIVNKGTFNLLLSFLPIDLTPAVKIVSAIRETPKAIRKLSTIVKAIPGVLDPIQGALALGNKLLKTYAKNFTIPDSSSKQSPPPPSTEKPAPAQHKPSSFSLNPLKWGKHLNESTTNSEDTKKKNKSKPKKTTKKTTTTTTTTAAAATTTTMTTTPMPKEVETNTSTSTTTATASSLEKDVNVEQTKHNNNFFWNLFKKPTKQFTTSTDKSVDETEFLGITQPFAVADLNGKELF